ncbi:hypothetical protein BSKO_00040 [Bryopsis sp. KO-2023]|nr:hypothetical protein BSKO_00040 [Bryopsis sp. KO-2023]
MGRNPSKHQCPPSPESLALVASWLDNPSHLGRPPVEDFLKDDDTVRSLQVVAGLLCHETDEERNEQESRVEGESSGIGYRVGRSTEGEPFSLPPPVETVAPRSSGAGEAESASQALPDQLRHRGVETLLTEYYKMVATSKGQSRNVANRHKPSLNDQLMWLLFPNLPRCVEMQSLVGLTKTSLIFLAGVAVHLAVLVLPAWLYVLRHMANSGKGNFLFVFIVGVLGAWLLYWADKVDSSRRREEETSAKNRIASFRIGHNGRMPPESHNFLAAVAECAESADSSNHRNARPPTAEGSQPSSAAINLHASGNRDYAVLAREVEVVKFAVLGDRSIPKQTNGSGVGELRLQIRNLCDAVGIESDTQSLASIALMRAKLKEVRRVVGC